MISLKIDWFVVQGTFRNFQHHSLKASILWHSVFFTVQLSQLYMTTGTTIALTIQTFVSRVMSLLFNILSKFVIAFPPRSNCPDFSIDTVSIYIPTKSARGFPADSVVKKSTCQAGEAGLIPGSGRSSREGNGNPLQYSYLGNPMDRGA